MRKTILARPCPWEVCVMGEGLESVKVSWDGGLIRVLPLCALGGGGGRLRA